MVKCKPRCMDLYQAETLSESSAVYARPNHNGDSVKNKEVIDLRMIAFLI
jgi:hypothetical protein